MKSALGKSAGMETYYQLFVKESVFDTMKDVMMTAIALGFKHDKRIPVNKYGGDAIKEHLFKDDMDFLNIVAVLTTKDIKILLEENKEEKYKILEEYAEGGMEMMVSASFSGQYADSEKFLGYVKSYSPTISTEKKDLSDLFGAIIDEMDS